MKILIKHPHDLRNVVIPFHKGANEAPELVPLVLAQLVISICDRQQCVGNLGLHRCRFSGVRRKINLANRFNITVVVQLELPKLLLGLINQINIDFLRKARLLVVGLEGLQNLLLGVHKIQDVGILFSWIGAVQAAQGLDCFHIPQFLVHDHGVQQWLVKAGLVLLGHNQHIAFVVENLLCLGLFHRISAAVMVHTALRVLRSIWVIRVFDTPGEGNQDLNVIIAIRF